MSIDDFKRRKVDIFRQYCYDRGFGIANKRQEELVALAYTTYTQNVPIVFRKDEEQLQVKQPVHNQRFGCRIAFSYIMIFTFGREFMQTYFRPCVVPRVLANCGSGRDWYHT